MLLTERGVAYGTAVRLVDVHGTGAVLDVCGRFDREPGHAPGWLVAALRDGYRTAAPDAPGGDGAEAEPKSVAPILLWHQVQAAMRREDVPVTAFERVDDGPDGAPRWRRRAGVAEPTKGSTLHRVRGGEA